MGLNNLTFKSLSFRIRSLLKNKIADVKSDVLKNRNQTLIPQAASQASERQIIEKLEQLAVDIKGQKDQGLTKEDLRALKAELRSCNERLEKVEIASERCKLCTVM